MHSINKNFSLTGAIFLISLILFSGCMPPSQASDIPHMLYTEAVKTVAVQLTSNALLTPSITPTETPEPTPTNTSTPKPTPTVPSPTPTWGYHTAGEVKIPILVYYDIADELNDSPDFDPDSKYSISSDIFRQQIETLYDAGYQAIPITLLVNAIIYGAELPAFPIAITFDSTSVGIYNKAFPIMNEIGFVGNIFLTVNQLDGDGRLSSSQVGELLNNGWRIGSRGMNGYDLTANHQLLSEEISGSRLALEEKIGVPITIFSFPYGRVDDTISPRVSAWGYEAAVGLSWYQTSIHSKASLFYLSRFEIKNGETLEQIFNKLPWQPDSLPTTIPTNNN